MGGSGDLFRESARAEVDFLKSLLPGGTATAGFGALTRAWVESGAKCPAA